MPRNKATRHLKNTNQRRDVNQTVVEEASTSNDTRQFLPTNEALSWNRTTGEPNSAKQWLDGQLKEGSDERIPSDWDWRQLKEFLLYGHLIYGINAMEMADQLKTFAKTSQH